MKTYSRKQQVIEDIVSLCRLCLLKCDQMVPIFSEQSNVYISLEARIMMCLGFKVTQEEIFPNSICEKCHMEVQNFYRFRKKCEISLQKLNRHKLALKELAQKTKSMEIKDNIENLCNGINDDKNQLKLGLNNNLITNKELCNLTQEESDCIEDQRSSQLIDNDLNTYFQVIDLDYNVLDEEPAMLIIETDSTNDTNDPDTIKDVQIEENTQQKGQSSELSLIISNLLVSTGTLTESNGVLTCTSDIRTLQLESKEGDYVVMELTEEDPEDQWSLCKEKSSITQQSKDINEPSQIEIITSKYDRYRFKGVNCEPKEADCESNKYKCSKCNVRLSSAGSLRRHLLVHSDQRPHVCESCGRAFRQKSCRDRHALLHNQVRPFQCEKCPKSYTQLAALTSHTAKHDPHRVLKLHHCPLCVRVFLHRSGVSRHLKSMHSSRCFICDACKRPFKDRSSLARHISNMKHNECTQKTDSMPSLSLAYRLYT